MNYDEIGKFILKLRKEKGYSQNDLAQIIPISRQAISKWERGVTIPDSSTLVRLSEIFDVTINELLKGERGENNSLEEFEQTTLSFVDDTVIRTEKLRRRILILFIIVLLLIVSFLSYYFINSYNTVKVYYMCADGDNFHLTNGILITTSSRKYIKFDALKYNSQNININKIRLYYKKNDKNIDIFIDDTITDILFDYNGYDGLFNYKDYSYVLDNSYLEINYNDNLKETLKINYIRSFVNDNLLFFLEHKDYDNKKVFATDNQKYQLIIDKMKEIGELKDDSYYYSFDDSNSKYELFYYSYMRELYIFKDNSRIIYYNMPANSIICDKKIEFDDNYKTCEDYFNFFISKHILNK